MNDTSLFAFEDDFVTTLRCVPMAVRFKLDACGIKLTLRQWSRFTKADRQALLLAPCDTAEQIDAYRDCLATLVCARTGEVARVLPDDGVVPWDQVAATPQQVVAFASSLGVRPPSDADWRRLTALQRFVLLKLSRDNHDNVNFAPALREFGLLDGPPAGAVAESGGGRLADAVTPGAPRPSRSASSGDGFQPGAGR